MDRRRTALREAYGTPALVVAITLVGLALRVPSWHDALFGDELSSFYVATGRSFGSMVHLLDGRSIELNPPLFFTLGWASEKLFGVSPEALRLPSLLAGEATIPLAYALGRMTVGRRAGLLAATLAALCPFMIYYSTEARAYALVTALVLLSTVALIRALRSSGRGWWAAYALAACAAVYTHSTSVFVLGTQFVWALVAHPGARRTLLVASAAACAGFVPWIPTTLRIDRSPGRALIGALEPFNVHAVALDLARWTAGHPYLALGKVPGRPGELLIAAGLTVALVAWAVRAARRGTVREEVPAAAGSSAGRAGAMPVRRATMSVAGEAPGRDASIVAVVALATPAGAALYSMVRVSVWDARDIITSWPGLAVGLAALIVLAPRRWRVPAAALVLVGFALGAVRLLPATFHRPDYRSAIAYVDHVAARATIADVPSVTPGPPTETEAALVIAGTVTRHPLLRIGIPSLAAVLAAPPYALMPPTPGAADARRAAAATPPGRTLAVIVPAAATVADLESIRRRHLHIGGNEFAVFATFLGALPARFRAMGARTFRGLVPVTVYVLRG